MQRSTAQAVLLTGVYGSGKTSVVAEIAAVLEERNMRFAALDLDWLEWFDAGWGRDHTDHGMMLKNLEGVVANYLAADIEFFVLALWIEGQAELDSIRAGIPMPLKVVRLTVPFETIQERLRADPTTGRIADLDSAAGWLAEGRGVGMEDFEVSNDRPIRDVAIEVLARLGWA